RARDLAHRVDRGEGGGGNEGRVSGAGAEPAPRAPARGCRECGATLADDQRYCLSCGSRVGPLAVPGPSAAAAKPPARRSCRLPAPRTAAVMPATPLGFGIFIGIVIGPSLSPTSYATGPLSVVLPEPASSGTGGSPSSSGAGAAPPSLGSPVANTGAAAPR